MKRQDTQLPGEELCITAALSPNNASVRNHLSVGSEVLSLGTKESTAVNQEQPAAR